MKKSFFKALAACLAVVLIGGCISLFGCGKKSSDSDTLDINDNVIVEATGVQHVLILGDDSWEDNTPGRSDLQMLARIDFDNKLVTLVSIPRDAAWSINGETCKLNEVYHQQGGDGACKAISEITGVQVTDWVSIGFDGLEAIVDYFGGIEVNVPYSINYSFYTGDYPNEYFAQGLQTVDGWRAMALSRARTTYAEYGFLDDSIRQVADRYMFVSLMENLFKDPTQAVSVIKNLAKNVSSNMKFGKIAGMVKKLAEGPSIEIYTTTAPVDGDIDEASGYFLCPIDPDDYGRLMDVVESGGDPATVSDMLANVKNPTTMPYNAHYTITF